MELAPKYKKILPEMIEQCLKDASYHGAFFYFDYNEKSKEYEFTCYEDGEKFECEKPLKEEKKKGYSVVEDKRVTAFWQKYYDFVEEYYPQLNIKRYDGPRGANAWWPGFFSPVKNIRIDHKSNKGYVDLKFDGVGEYFSEISEILKDKLDKDMAIIKTGKSMSIRIKVPVVNFDEEFDKYIDEIKISLNSVERLQKLLSKIDYKKILDLKNK